MVEIVPFEESHARQLLDLSLRAWEPVFDQMERAVPKCAFHAFYPDGWRVRQVADIEAVLQCERAHVRVATRGGAVLGWVAARLHADDRMGEIYMLAVDPNMQRRGIGRALIEHAADEIRLAGMEIVMVETGGDAGHAPARAAYEDAGFERWPVARYFRSTT